MIVNDKVNTQFTITPTSTNYKNNPHISTFNGLWHPTAHPLKIWRKTGTSQHLGTNIQNSSKPCANCKIFKIVPGKPFKMLGKNASGINKLTSVTNNTNCDLCDPTKGPTGTNSAGAKIRSANTNLKIKYYNSSINYLKARCKSVSQGKIIMKKDGIVYFTDGKAVWPSSDPSTSAGTYETKCYSNKYNTLTYKPSNPQYAKQGPVNSSARLARLKYNTINKTNNSISESYSRDFTYNGINNSIYFIKNKTRETTKCCHKTATTTTTTDETTDETTTYNTPYNFASILTQTFDATLEEISSFENLDRILISFDDGISYLSIDDNYDIAFINASSLTADTATYDDILKATFQIVRDSTEDYYRLDSEMHSMYSLDYASTDGLVFRNTWGYDRNTDSGYLLFDIDTTNQYLIAYKRYVYDGTPYIIDSTFNRFEVVYYVIYENNMFALTTDQSASNMKFDKVSNLDLSIPTAFNPASTAYVTNDRVVWSSLDSYEDNKLYDDGTNSLIYINMESAYQSQVTTSGDDADTSTAAATVLSAIQTAVEGEGNTLQYDTAVYTAFRNAVLNTTLQSNTIVNGEVGQPTAPYVYYTNETDDDGVYHPFMVVASYSIADKPNRLIDVASPPGEGGVAYAEASVTRDATLGLFLSKIPMKNYGYVTTVTDNSMNNSLYADASANSTKSAYNWASISSIGVAIDGVNIYPVLNNTLTPAAEKSEITNTGIHVGQGMGLHYHADGHSATENGLNLYNITDYVDQSHPPLIGFGLDGIALYGKYEDSYSSMDGYDESIDDYGGHSHGNYGYHYHAHEIENAVTTIGDNAGSVTGNVEYTYYALMKGAWYGLINDVPEFWDDNTDAPAISFAQESRYVGNST